MKKCVIIWGLVLCMLLSLAACVRVDEKDKDEQKESETEEFFKTEEEVFEIETPYVSLKFPEKWKDYVVYEGLDNTVNYSVSFFASFGESKLTLYTVVFGDSPNGYKLGTVKAGSGNVDVYIIDTYDATADTLSAGELEIYSQMYRDVNVIISKLVYDNGMVLAD